MKLKKSVKAKWVKALRSGKYTQGIEYLRNDDIESGANVFCCLGVACDLGLTTRCLSGSEFVDPTFLPVEVQEKLANFNDGYGGAKRRSFKWIASYIERYL